MSGWPLASTQDEPPTPQEKYQAFISYANSCGLMRHMHEESLRDSFRRQGIEGNPALLSAKDRHAAMARFTPAETNIHFTTYHYWLGGLYVLVEGWAEDLRLTDPAIDALLKNAAYCGLLRRVRNAIFHYKPSLRVPQFAEFYQADPALIGWVIAVDEAFKTFIWAHPTRPT